MTEVQVRVAITAPDGTVLELLIVRPVKAGTDSEADLAYAIRDRLEHHFEVDEV